MVDRPVIFSAPMVRALLEGRKTQTRRLAGKWRVSGDATREGEAGVFIPSPWQRVRPGERLWVREVWGTHAGPGILCCEHDRPNALRVGGGYSPVTFRADAAGRAWGMYGPPKWRSPLHMPRWASRLTLTVTAARVERLQEITLGDICAEGLAQSIYDFKPVHRGFDAWIALWDSLHGEGAWDANPEVVALSFTVRKGNIDHA